MVLKKTIIILFLFIGLFNASYAGPPFNTDDPEPVEHRHWEYYFSSMNVFQSNFISGTLPHIEVNYGFIRNFQIHLLAPVNYNRVDGDEIQYGYANTEMGVKFRFFDSKDSSFQIGTFPIFEVPTVKNDTFGNNELQVYLPLWFQKSWGKFTSYGGCGYWFNPGTNNKDWIFAGWELQYDFTKMLTLGGEVYYHTATSVDTKSSLAFNLGGFINFTDRFHFIFSFGHSLINDSYTTSYLGLLWTI